jgi:hypothetical protein
VFGAAWVISVVLTALGLIAARDSSPDWGLLFESPGQLVAVAVGGIFTMGIDAMGMTINASVVWLPLFVTAVIVAGLIFLGRRDELAHASVSRGARWLRSAITGLALSLLVLLVAAILPIHYDLGSAPSNPLTGGLSGGGTGSAVSFTAFLGALLLGTVVSYFARARVSAERAPKASTPVRLALATAWRTIAVYVAVVSALLTIGLIIYFATQGADALLTIFLWLPTLVLMGVGFVNLSPVGLFGGGQAFASIGETSYWMPTELPIWGTAIILVINVALIVAVGMVLALSRSNFRPSTAIRWVTTVASFAVAGAVISLISGIAFRTSLDMGSAGDALDGLFSGSSSDALESAASMRATVGLAAWTFIIFAILGALVEAAATYLSPLLLPLLPASLRARIVRATAGVAPATAATASGVAGGVDAGVATGVADGSSPQWASASGTTTSSDSAPAVVPMSPERKKKVVIVLASIGAAIVLIVGATVAISVVNSTVYSPKNQVESYLDSIIDGNATAALDAGELEAGEDSQVLLTDEVLKATEGGITGYSITDTFTSGDTATVIAEIDQNGTSEEVSYEVVRSGKTAVLFDNWELGTVFVGSMTVTVPEGTTELLVNDVPVSIEDLEPEYGYLSLAAFPGEYTVSIGGDNEYLSSEPATLVIPAGIQAIPETLAFTVEPTEAFEAEVSSQIDDLLETCAATGELRPDDCPFYTFAYGDTTDIKWTIDTPATFSLEDYGNGEWYVSTDDRGTAIVSYTRDTDYTEPESLTEDVDFTVEGAVEMVDGAPVYTYGY